MFTIVIEKHRWYMSEPDADFGQPDHTLYDGRRWSAGPIEIARILRRIGLNVTVVVEP